ncbi:MAG: diacylglycerol kinase family lipid kinase [Verrucomicrobia bacterium]|nr:MAG: diacylglycerol kinase family lipid kinase [Verrucomicrobiota bacterium]
MQGAVIFNPTARGGSARRFRDSLARFAADWRLAPTTGPGTAPELARQAALDGAELVVAAGGDGTVSEVIRGLASDPALLARVRLAVIPLGTINVFARELRIPRNLEAAWRIAREGSERRVDVPVAVFRDANGASCRWAFAQLAGAGLDSRAVAAVSWPLKQKIGPVAYLVAGLRALEGPHPTVRVVTSQGTLIAEGPMALVGNGTLYGGSVAMHPGARLDDGELDVRVFRRVGPGLIVRFGWVWLTGRPLRPGKDVCRQLANLRLEADGPLPLEIDGDHAGWLPAEFSVLPRALRVMTP